MNFWIKHKNFLKRSKILKKWLKQFTHNCKIWYSLNIVFFKLTFKLIFNLPNYEFLNQTLFLKFFENFWKFAFFAKNNLHTIVNVLYGKYFSSLLLDYRYQLMNFWFKVYFYKIWKKVLKLKFSFNKSKSHVIVD